MKTNYLVLLNAVNAFKELSERDISFKVGYNIAKIIKKIDVELEYFEKKRMEFLKEYGDPETFESQNIRIKEENLEKFNSKIKELMEVEIELDIKKMRLDDLEEIKFSSKNIQMIQDFIEEERAD